MKKFLPILISACLIYVILTQVNLEDVATRLDEITTTKILLVLLLFACNLILVSWRLHRILRHFGENLSLWTAFRANVSGLVASLVMINLIGSVLGRQMVLRHAGVGPAVVATISGYERILLTLVGGSLFLGGGLALVGASGLVAILGDIPVVPILIAITLAAGVTVLASRTPFELDLLRRLYSRRNVVRSAEVVGLTVVAQGFVLATYVVTITALGHSVNGWLLLGAAAIVSFAASLPISVNGWGIREIASIFAFGILGIPAADAVAASVLVGLSSTVLVLLAAPILMRPATRASDAAPDSVTPSIQKQQQSLHYQKMFAVLMALACGILLFFQVPAEIQGNIVTINLGDPLALLVFAMVAAMALMHRQLPFYLPKPFVLWMIGLSALLALAFAIGAARFGVTAWAAGNRGFGWIVILGYVACGALIAGQFGDHGRRRLAQAVAIAGASVLLVHLGHRLAFAYDLTTLVPPRNFDGFSANRNAFAFQLLAAAAMFQAYLISLRRVGWLHMGILSVLYLGAMATGSLTGFVTIGAVAVALALSLSVRARALIAILIAAAVYIGVVFLDPIGVVFLDPTLGAGRRAAAPMGRIIAGVTYSATSIAERWESLIGGYALWRAHIVFGAGLGAYILQQVVEEGRPLVIHSTYVWIAAEMGLLGLLVVAWLPGLGAVRLWSAARARRVRGLPALPRRDLALIGLLLVFGIFSLTHEVAYQRIFWLLLGALVASPRRPRAPQTEVAAAGPPDHRG